MIEWEENKVMVGKSRKGKGMKLEKGRPNKRINEGQENEEIGRRN
jgi:hypothetical protein